MRNYPHRVQTRKLTIKTKYYDFYIIKLNRYRVTV